jgi:predicted flap endonuclease-1-like 5' DNA nuclease
MTLANPTLDPKAETALRLPVGLTSPLWLMIGSAAMIGAAFFWATRWMQPATPDAGEKALPRAEPEVQAAVEKAAVAAEAVADVAVEAVAETAEAVVDALPEAPAVVETVIDPVIEAPVAVLAEVPVLEAADDLTRLTGVGPKLAANLAARGVTRFAQIAAWTDEEIAALDKDMKLMGRIAREAWVAQAKRFTA